MITFPGKEYLRERSLEKVRSQLRCVFVLSTGRVGTDTLTRLFNLSPGIRAYHEPFPELLRETKLAYQQPETAADVPSLLLNLRYFAIPGSTSLRLCYRRGLIYAETSNRLTFIAPALAEYFPQSRFIHLHRDPPDVIRSSMRRRFYDGNAWDDHRIEPRRTDPHHSSWSEWSTFQKCCWYWREINGFSLDFMNSLPAERRLSLPSSTLFDSDVPALQNVFRWLRVPAPTAVAIRDLLAVRHNAQKEGDFPRWDDWTEQQRSQMADIVGDVAENLGYGEFVAEAVPTNAMS